MKRTLLLMAAVGLFSAIPAMPDNGSYMTICHASSNGWNIISVSKKELPYHIPGHPADVAYVDGVCTPYGG